MASQIERLMQSLKTRDAYGLARMRAQHAQLCEKLTESAAYMSEGKMLGRMGDPECIARLDCAIRVQRVEEIKRDPDAERDERDNFYTQYAHAAKHHETLKTATAAVCAEAMRLREKGVQGIDVDVVREQCATLNRCLSRSSENLANFLAGRRGGADGGALRVYAYGQRPASHTVHVREPVNFTTAERDLFHAQLARADAGHESLKTFSDSVYYELVSRSREEREAFEREWHA